MRSSSLETMSSRQPYHGSYRKLVLAFDIGITYSGVSYSILGPGLYQKYVRLRGTQLKSFKMNYPSICLMYPAQQKVDGTSTIPSIIYYDKEGKVRAVGAEATQESVLDQAEDEEWTKVERYLPDI